MVEPSGPVNMVAESFMADGVGGQGLSTAGRSFRVCLSSSGFERPDATPPVG